jgi:hypothetical protein
MASKVPLSPITMTSPTLTVASLPAGIYQTSSVTFIEDTQAYTTVNIN